jgi:hypothetical protein
MNKNTKQNLSLHAQKSNKEPRKTQNIVLANSKRKKKENKRERENTHARPEWSNKTLKPHAADTKI